MEIKNLPKIPEEALPIIIQEILRNTPQGNGTFTDLKKSNLSRYNELYYLIIAARKIADRSRHRELREASEECLKINEKWLLFISNSSWS